VNRDGDFHLSPEGNGLFPFFEDHFWFLTADAVDSYGSLGALAPDLPMGHCEAKLDHCFGDGHGSGSLDAYGPQGRPWSHSVEPPLDTVQSPAEAFQGPQMLRCESTDTAVFRAQTIFGLSIHCRSTAGTVDGFRSHGLFSQKVDAKSTETIW